jgi:hypothetical protein
MAMCVDFITRSMDKSVARHDILLRLMENVAEYNPFADLRLLQVCGVNSFGRVISSVPSDIIHPFTIARDAAVISCFEAI